jgi:glycosyltransferase involved in cell wall biosynthesis
LTVDAILAIQCRRKDGHASPRDEACDRPSDCSQEKSVVGDRFGAIFFVCTGKRHHPKEAKLAGLSRDKRIRRTRFATGIQEVIVMHHGTSVIIPVRNGARFVTEAINSALLQLSTDDEIIVIDDASTDATRDVVMAIHDRRIHLMEGLGRGVSSARNIGLAAAAKEFVAFLDHDDLWPAARHAVLLEALMNTPHSSCAIGRVRLRMERDAIVLPYLANWDGHHKPGANLGAALFRRNLLCRIGGFDESLQLSEDLDYFYRLREAGLQFELCDVDGIIYRRHASNCTNDQMALRNSLFHVVARKMARRQRVRILGYIEPNE